ncbi:MAG: hypothetical protein D6704_09265 [Nitrospirae bacterium]|nr:MAG: hypothetical protein D6704_09265 [Nitrospirota bacterium]
MNGGRIFLLAMAGSAFTLSVAFANPALLPSHPGYPAKGVSPVTGQRTAYDEGQSNAAGDQTLSQAATYYDPYTVNNVQDPNRLRIKKSRGAGRLPEVEGALNRVNVNPAGATSTVVNR